MYDNVIEVTWGLAMTSYNAIRTLGNSSFQLRPPECSHSPRMENLVKESKRERMARVDSD